MKEKIYQYLLKSLEHSSQLVFLYEKDQSSAFFANKQALYYLGNDEGKIDIHHIFTKQEEHLLLKLDSIKELKENHYIIMDDLEIVTNIGDIKKCNIQIGYADEEEAVYYVEIFLIEDHTYKVNLKKQIELEKELANIGQYFNILESMCGGMLYRFDIKNRILYRNALTANIYQVPDIGRNYPDVENLKKIVHPEDLQEYVDFIERVIEGQEGFLDSRIVVPSGAFEYHRMTFKAYRNTDGTIKEMVGCAVNVNQLKETQKALDNINRYFDGLQELSDDLLFRIDIENKILIRHEQKVNLFGLTEAIVRFPEDVYKGEAIHPDDLDIYKIFVDKVFAGEAGSIEVRMREQEWELFRFRNITWIPVVNEKHEVKEVIGKLIDVQEVKELEEKATYDDLTNMLNKRAIEDSASNILNQSKSQDSHALIFMDLDDFKYVNDNLGHAFGDYLLGELGRRLVENIGTNDFIGRVGGDEFVIFLANILSKDKVIEQANCLLSAISEEFNDGTMKHIMNGSLGIAIYPEHGKSYDELYHHADLALYSSKHKGKNQVTLYTEGGK